MVARVGNSNLDVLDLLRSQRRGCAENRNDPQCCQESLSHKILFISSGRKKKKKIQLRKCSLPGKEGRHQLPANPRARKRRAAPRRGPQKCLRCATRTFSPGSSHSDARAQCRQSDRADGCASLPPILSPFGARREKACRYTRACGV